MLCAYNKSLILHPSLHVGSGGSTTGPLGPGPQAPELQVDPELSIKQLYDIIINQRGYKRSPGLDKHISHGTVTVRP